VRFSFFYVIPIAKRGILNALQRTMLSDNGLAFKISPSHLRSKGHGWFLVISKNTALSGGKPPPNRPSKNLLNQLQTIAVGKFICHFFDVRYFNHRFNVNLLLTNN
jgi:hypothetical protein